MGSSSIVPVQPGRAQGRLVYFSISVRVWAWSAEDKKRGSSPWSLL
jgi:hypothetical protein